MYDPKKILAFPSEDLQAAFGSYASLKIDYLKFIGYDDGDLKLCLAYGIREKIFDFRENTHGSLVEILEKELNEIEAEIGQFLEWYGPRAEHITEV